MKKDRNSFFESSNFNISAMGPNMGMNMGMPQMNAASSSFYAAQNMPMPLPNYTMPNQSMGASYSELESRMARLERSINRLEARLNKSEGSTYYTKETYETDGNMYIV